MPNSPSNEVVEDKHFTVNDIEDLLGEDDKNEIKEEKEEEVIEEEEVKDEEKEEDEDDKEEKELELKEDEEEKLEEEIKSPPRKKEIEKEFPGFFKKFPEVEREYYKAQQFTEVIGTVEDAKELVSRVQVLDEFETDLSEGNTEKILNQVKQNSPEAFDKIVDNYLLALGKVDRDSYLSVIEGIVKRGIISALEHAQNREDEELFKSAKAYYKYMFPQDKEIRMPEARKVQNTEDDRLKREREEFNKERFEIAQNDLQGRVDNIIRSNISNYMDPNDKMTPYVKKNAIKDAMNELEETIARDATFKKTVLDPLWKKAHDDKFSRASLDRIKSAYLSKAKTILKPIIIKARSEALKGLGSRVEKDRKGPITPGRISTSSSERGRNKEPEKGMKTLDYLNSD